MEHLCSIKTLLQQGYYMTKLDLKDAYLSVPIHPDSQKYLRFLWKNKTYQFKALPFGLNIAPIIFTRLMKPVAGFLRKRGVRLIVYLDDMLIIGASAEEATLFTTMAIELLESLGFTLNQEIHPDSNSNDRISRLHYQFEHNDNTIAKRKDNQTAETVSPDHVCLETEIKEHSSTSGIIRVLPPSHLEGTSSFSFPTSSTYSRFNDFPSRLRGGGSSPNQTEARTSVVAAKHHQRELQSHHVPLSRHYDILRQTNGKWSATERLLHINILELKAAFLGLKSLLKNHRAITVALNMDNSTAVAYVNHKRGTHSLPLLELTLELWDWCIQRDLFIIAHHLPGRTNIQAHLESREFLDNSDWMINPTIVKAFLTNCRTDLFASRLTRQLTDFIIWRPDPEAQHSDAFTVNWKGLAGYAFPPFNLVPMVLNKVQSDQTEIVLIAPVWQAQPWWPLLLQLHVQQPVLLPNNKDLLQDPSDPFLIHPMYPLLHLGAFHISSDVTKQKAFLRTLPTYSSQQLVAPHAKPTNQLAALEPLVFYKTN